MREWDDFDCTLATDLSQLPPPPSAVNAVTPWRTAVHHIAWGLCLTCFTLQFLYLDYLLPAIGTVALYLGFRALRDNNRWFRLSWYASICKVILLYTAYLLAATPFSDVLLLPRVVLSAVTMLTMLLGLWLGLRQVVRPDSGSPASAFWALVWYGVLLLLAVVQPDLGWPGALGMLAAFLLILCSLLRLCRRLDTLGYALVSAPVRMDAGRVWRVSLISLALVVLLVSAVCSHAPLGGTDIEQNFDSPETAAIRRELTDLGLPEELVARLRPEDLLRLTGAVESTEPTGGLPMGDDPTNRRQNQVYALLFPDGSVQLLHAFSAELDSTFWQNAVTLRSNASLSEVTGRMFYTQSGVSKTAALPFSETVYSSGTDLFGLPFYSYQAESALFSWPLGSRDRWGYVIAAADQEANPQTVLDDTLGYAASPRPAYPYQRPAGYDWTYGRRFYYGDGSGLIWKADEDASQNSSPSS